MVATPKNGTVVLRLANGETKIVDVYFSDVAAAYARFNSSGSAGTSSPDFLTMPRNGVIEDVSIETGMADTKQATLEINGNTTGSVFRYVPFVSTSNQRPKLAIPINQGSTVRLIQGA